MEASERVWPLNPFELLEKSEVCRDKIAWRKRLRKNLELLKQSIFLLVDNTESVLSILTENLMLISDRTGFLFLFDTFIAVIISIFSL